MESGRRGALGSRGGRGVFWSLRAWSGGSIRRRRLRRLRSAAASSAEEKAKLRVEMWMVGLRDLTVLEVEVADMGSDAARRERRRRLR